MASKGVWGVAWDYRVEGVDVDEVLGQDYELLLTATLNPRVCVCMCARHFIPFRAPALNCLVGFSI